MFQPITGFLPPQVRRIAMPSQRHYREGGNLKNFFQKKLEKYFTPQIGCGLPI
jgi:hypothetical protein